jgi:hypothetical protein
LRIRRIYRKGAGGGGKLVVTWKKGKIKRERVMKMKGG